MAPLVSWGICRGLNAEARLAELKPNELRTRRWLRALVWLDLVVLIMLVALVAHQASTGGHAEALSAGRLGLTFVSARGPATIASVVSSSAAERAGLRAGDVIVKCGGAPVKGAVHVAACVRDLEGRVELVFARGNEQHRVSAHVESTGLAAPPAIHEAGEPTADVLGPLLAVLVLLGAGLWTWQNGDEGATVTMAIVPLGLLFARALLAPSAPTFLMSALAIWGTAELLDRLVLGERAPKVFSRSPGWSRSLLFAAWVDLTLLIRIGVILASVVMLFSLKPQLTPLEQLLRESPPSLAGRALLMATVVVAGPIAEERFFRGVLLTSLSRTLRPEWALIIMTVTFGVMHAGKGIWALPVVVMGLVLGWLAQSTRGLLAPIALHMGHNLIAGTALLLRLGEF